MINDIDMITGKFLTPDFLPKNKKYLLKYYSAPCSRAFLLYYLYGGDKYALFTPHTGHICTQRWWYFEINRLKKIIKLNEEARFGFDLDTVEKLEKGKIKKKNFKKT